MTHCWTTRMARLMVFGAVAAPVGKVAASPTLPLPPPSSTRALIAQTAAVVEGDVVGVEYTYDERQGPRTIVTLGNLRTRLGRYEGDKVRLSTLGGPLPDGRRLYVPELPEIAESGRYLVFLRNDRWLYSPVLSDLALRLETVGDRAVVIDQDGRAVTGVGHGGLRRDDPALFEPVHDAKRPSAPPVLRSKDVPRAALTSDRLVAALAEYAKKEGLELTGTFAPEPDARRVWNKVPTEPDDSVAAGTGGDEKTRSIR